METTMRDKDLQKAIKKGVFDGIFEYEFFDKFTAPFYGVVILELLYISFHIGAGIYLAVHNIFFYDGNRMGSVINSMLFPLINTVLVFVGLFFLLRVRYIGSFIAIMLSTLWGYITVTAIKNVGGDWAAMIAVGTIFFLFGLFLHFKVINYLSE